MRRGICTSNTIPTDGDLGVHGLMDDHGWRELCVFAPDGARILWVKPGAQLEEQAIAGIFFESREPELDEFGFEELAASFPEGEYTVRGLNVDGTTLTGVINFTRDVPAPPVITLPAGLGEDDEEGAEIIVSTDNLVVGLGTRHRDG